ncbi:transporter substrate-binding domain-containing protein [Endozoicomonas sp. SM1973]|uniref:Transporter substrate-binding domain-containing protein n=1 Tax=Spartinivicinus marinus TaxID=2994442 RepID=A0A853IE12_9GAMM|nr:transporter substrate-binding domain-containing protein [Spartinivicinus marinus]MCX4029127.1 transporter substrate-binding domain-containing protein [Spartinivicinus marinus]NYZ67747.1 transporter substrate-binding domain-containing protein [Spartinivicinus marinus]
MKFCTSKSLLLLIVYTLTILPIYIIYVESVLSCELTIFGNSNKPPKYYLDQEGKPQGILVDMMVYLGEQMDCKFNIRLYPWKRAYKYALAGEGGIIGFSKNSQRLKLFDYSEVMYYDDMILVTTRRGKFDYQTIKDLRGKTLSVTLGASFGDDYDNAVASKLFSVRAAPFPEDRLLQLLSGQVDVVLLGPGKLGLQAAIARNKKLNQQQDQFVILPKPFKRDPNFLGIAKTLNMQPFIKRFNQALHEGVRSGKFDAILLHYLTEK